MMTNLLKRDNSKYCAFHREIGHTMKECKILKNKICKLIQNNGLREFISCLKQRPNQGQSD